MYEQPEKGKKTKYEEAFTKYFNLDKDINNYANLVNDIYDLKRAKYGEFIKQCLNLDLNTNNCANTVNEIFAD